MNVNTQYASKLYSAARRMVDAATPEKPEESPDHGGFAQALTDAVADTVQTVHKGEQTAMRGMAGKADAHSVVEALADAEMAMETAVTVRDKVVDAYQEILRMPV